jgi:hypothetical protein
MHTPPSITTDAALERFFEALSKGFAEAQAAAGGRHIHLSIAGRQVLISLGGEGLLHLARPLAHLQDEAGTAPPDLEIRVWEGPAGWTPPPPFWKQGQQGYQGEILGLGSGRFQVNYHDTSGLFQMWDRQARRALYWIPRATDLPFWEIASPFRIVFHWWARLLDGHVVHAGAVGRDGRGVLLVGKSGSGKSTASLACLCQGMEFVGDDYVLLLSEPVATAHSIYSSAKLHTDFLGKVLPEWKHMVGEEIGPEHKSVFFLQETMPGTLRRSMRIAAVVIPHIGGQVDATLEPRPASEALLALAPSTLFQFPEARREAMSFLAGLIRGLPVYALQNGTNLASGPQALLRLLAAGQRHGTEVRVG